jgi:hypothetical protein
MDREVNLQEGLSGESSYEDLAADRLRRSAKPTADAAENGAADESSVGYAKPMPQDKGFRYALWWSTTLARELATVSPAGSRNARRWRKSPRSTVRLPECRIRHRPDHPERMVVPR